MEQIIEIRNLTKSYNGHPVLRDISFSVRKGEMFALLGANGAGKTTTLECIEGLRKADSGEIIIRGSIGVQLQSTSLPPEIKADEAVQLFSKWGGGTLDQAYLERLGMQEFAHKMYKALSTGQKRRLHLIICLLSNPDILFLDEPTAGLDVEGRVSLHTEIRRLKELGKTIILASHDMAEVEALCDHIAILKGGQVVFDGNSSALTQAAADSARIRIRFSADLPQQEFRSVIYRGAEQGELIFEARDIAAALIELSESAKRHGIAVRDVKVEHASLEERFIDILQEGNI